MTTAKKALAALKDAGVIDWFEIKRVPREDGIPAYTSVTAGGHAVLTEETYGNKSFLYFTCADHAMSLKAEVALQSVGVCPDHGWKSGHRDCDSFTFQIHRIKGWHHWQ